MEKGKGKGRVSKKGRKDNLIYAVDV